MRIALVASLVAPLTEPQANGPQSAIVDLARGLAARGNAVKVYAAAGSSIHGIGHAARTIRHRRAPLRLTRRPVAPRR
jgi:3-oxoacyl-(acyl-carrier-protein) synthase